MPPSPSDVSPVRVVVAGDWHGSTSWAVAILDHAANEGVQHIVQLGDFGFWHGRFGAAFLDALDDTLIRHGQILWFVDGNHEDFDLLLDIPVDAATGVRPIRDRIAHLPRGFRWQWAGRTWMALGGATSLDRPARRHVRSWWPQEEITDEDVRRAVAPGGVDVMVAHDCPSGIDVPRTPSG